jgi:hypothetical protein
MAKTPSLDAGLAKQHKSFANSISLVHLIAETRALNCNEAVSSKLPYVEPQTQAHDSHTSRKSAPFQVGAKVEPLYKPLQPAIRFLRVLLPASPKGLPRGSLATDSYIESVAKKRAYHVPAPADPIL